MKSRIFKSKRGGGYYLFFDEKGVKWNIERVTVANYNENGEEKGSSYYWIAESDNNNSIREPNKKKILERISQLSKTK